MESEPGVERVIVVGVDGSKGSRRAMAWVLEEARARDAVVRAVLVWDDPYTVIGPAPPVSAMGDDGVDRLHTTLADVVEAALGDSPGSAVKIDQRVVSGHPVKVLCGLAAGADMLVLGSRGRSRWGEFLLGSVSHACAQVAPVPVVIVPPSDRMPPGEAAPGGRADGG
ncbi:MAG TPA: universal stress protein [Acidimicrobiales bacterium]|nr:universal stress protein [Acidimicrobiales bacterium]